MKKVVKTTEKIKKLLCLLPVRRHILDRERRIFTIKYWSSEPLDINSITIFTVLSDKRNKNIKISGGIMGYESMGYSV